jgi:hypothetical protein
MIVCPRADSTLDSEEAFVMLEHGLGQQHQQKNIRRCQPSRKIVDNGMATETTRAVSSLLYTLSYDTRAGLLRAPRGGGGE